MNAVLLNEGGGALDGGYFGTFDVHFDESRNRTEVVARIGEGEGIDFNQRRSFGVEQILVNARRHGSVHVERCAAG